MEQTNIIKPEWFAVHVRSRHEFKVTDRLVKKDVETFLPTVERVRTWPSKSK